MESKDFSIFLTQLVPQILERLMQDETMSAHQLIHKFYQSCFYYITYFYETISSMGTHCIIRDLDNYINIHTG